MKPTDALKLPWEASNANVNAQGEPKVPFGLNLGREKLAEWEAEVWERIDRSVGDQLRRTCVTTQFMPVVRTSPSERTVTADKIGEVGGVMQIDQGAVLALNEASISFLLTKEQYHDERAIGTGATLAARAANRLAQRMDDLIFNGGGNPGLLAEAEQNRIVDVELLAQNNPGGYGENTFKAVAEAYAYLQSVGQYGPYALVLHAELFADAHAPLKSTLIMPADRIKPLMSAGFHGTGTLPERRGLMVSVGGNTVDVAIGVDGATAFAQIDDQENYRFRVYERFTVRIKDPRALVMLRFAEGA